jgi:hypothetical protein
MPQDVLLYTQDLQEARQEIESLGGRITQQFTDSVFVANLPDSVASQYLTRSSTIAPPNLDQISKLSADAWINLQDKLESGTPNPTEGLSWDAPGYEPPRQIQEDVQSLSATSILSTGTPTVCT